MFAALSTRGFDQWLRCKRTLAPVLVLQVFCRRWTWWRWILWGVRPKRPSSPQSARRWTCCSAVSDASVRETTRRITACRSLDGGDASLSDCTDGHLNASDHGQSDFNSCNMMSVKCTLSFTKPSDQWCFKPKTQRERSSCGLIKAPSVMYWLIYCINYFVYKLLKKSKKLTS